MTDPLDLDAIEAAARGVPEHERTWRADNHGGTDGLDGEVQSITLSAAFNMPLRDGGAVALEDFVLITGGADPITIGAASEAAAKHIASMDPATTLALVEEVRHLRELVKLGRADALLTLWYAIRASGDEIRIPLSVMAEAPPSASDSVGYFTDQRTGEVVLRATGATNAQSDR